MRRLLIIAGCLLGGAAGQAQNLQFYGLLPAWSQTGRLGARTDYNLFVSTTIDAVPRTISGVEYPAKDLQLYVQPSIIFKPLPWLNLAASYTYQRNNPLTDDFSNEHRLWEQVTLAQTLPRGRLSHRVRLEERFIQNRSTGRYPLSTRLRYQLGLLLPLQGKTLDNEEFYLNTYAEAYFSLTGAKNATFSENWAYVGLGYQLGRAGRLEAGYLRQQGVRNKQRDYRILNLLQVSWVTSFDLFHLSSARP